MARLTLSDDADRDLEDIYRQGAAMFGLAQADHYIDGLLDTLDLIAGFPGVARLRDEITPPVRAYPHVSHMILYDIDERGDVLVVRIRHAHENWTESPI